MSANTYLTERERITLENAKVGIAGAGGLGSNVAMLLVRAGMKKLVIADFDTVNESNLNRQFFFRHQLGEKKIDALAANLHLIEPSLTLELHDTRLSPENADWVFSGCQIIVEALDSAEGKAMLLRALLPTDKPIVSAIGLAGWGRSNDIRMRKVGRNLILVGDQTRDVRDGFAPGGVRVTIAAAMQAKGVGRLIVTMGSKGALICEGGPSVFVPARKVKAVDTTAAGDTFCGALCVAISEGKSLKEAAEFACGASALTVQKMGAQNSIPFRKDLQE